MKEINEALLEIEKICNTNLPEIEKPNLDKESKAEKLKELGFVNSKTVKRAQKSIEYWSNKEKDHKKELKYREELNNYLNQLKIDFPLHNIIFYDQLIKVAEKYNLFLAPIDLFVDEIPEEHADKIIKFNHEKCDKKWPTYISSRKSPLICKTISCENNYYDYNETPLYICADRPKFSKDKNKNIVQIGRELFEYNQKPKLTFKFDFSSIGNFDDPIVLKPIWLDNIKKLCFIIITAWGPEAKDIMIFNPINN